jgi:hypothetical protein
MTMSQRVLIAALASDPHTQGLFKFARVARDADFEVVALPPGSPPERILAALQQQDPAYVGFSYRLSQEIGVEEMRRMMAAVAENGLLKRANGRPRRFAFAGLPAAVERVEGSLPQYAIVGIRQEKDPLASVATALDFLELTGERRQAALESARARLFPPRLAVLDQLAGEVAADLSLEPPLAVPSEAARKSYTTRILESWPALPILRTHYGEAGDRIAPTVHGIEVLSEARVVDELSLGSSDLSQRHYNRPQEWVGRKNDGGVPYRDFNDLVALRQAALRGNYPAMKPYSHVVDMEAFVDECLRAGMLIGSHQAVPLFWFNRLDGRGEVEVRASIAEHARTVKKLAQHGIPVEMNDPNHWSSRWASDAVVTADYGLIASVMRAAGVRDIVLQMQFNKPRETSDCGDLAKFLTAFELVRVLVPPESGIQVWVETRTGIEQFEPDLAVARKQLARSTLLQMFLNPHAIHIVSYCEALHIAQPEDVIAASSVVRKAVKLFQKHRADLQPHAQTPEVQGRREFLRKESLFLLTEIAKLNPAFRASTPPAGLWPLLADGETLHRALTKGYMAAPGIFTEPLAGISARTFTDIMPGGFVDSVDPATQTAITEEARLHRLTP